MTKNELRREMKRRNLSLTAGERAKKSRRIFSRVEQLKALRLDVPQVTLLAWELKQKGFPLPDGILTTQELKEELAKCRSHWSM